MDKCISLPLSISCSVIIYFSAYRCIIYLHSDIFAVSWLHYVTLETVVFLISSISHEIALQVDVKIDYIKPANDGYPERTCATVSIAGINIAEALISKGLATALRHRQDDDQRSSQYDDLLAAESRAAKNGKGLHSKKEPPIHRVADIAVGQEAQLSILNSLIYISCLV